MGDNRMELIHLSIEIIAGIIVPVVISIIIPTIIAKKNRRETRNLVTERLDHLEKQIREHLRGYSDEEQVKIDKTLKEVFSEPSMRW